MLFSRVPTLTSTPSRPICRASDIADGFIWPSDQSHMPIFGTVDREPAGAALRSRAVPRTLKVETVPARNCLRVGRIG